MTGDEIMKSSRFQSTSMECEQECFLSFAGRNVNDHTIRFSIVDRTDSESEEKKTNCFKNEEH